MNYQEKKQLYESIMKNLAHVVKKALNEEYSEKYSTVEDNEKQGKVSQEDLQKIFTHYDIDKSKIKFVESVDAKIKITLIHSKKYNTYNYMDSNGHILSKMWFSFAYPFNGNYGLGYGSDAIYTVDYTGHVFTISDKSKKEASAVPSGNYILYKEESGYKDAPYRYKYLRPNGDDIFSKLHICSAKPFNKEGLAPICTIPTPGERNWFILTQYGQKVAIKIPEQYTISNITEIQNGKAVATLKNKEGKTGYAEMTINAHGGITAWKKTTKPE